MSTPEPIQPSRSNARTIAVVTVVIAFLAGLLIGVAGDRFWTFHMRERGGQRGRLTERIVAHLDHELHLSAQQRTEVERILNTHRQHIESISAAARPQIRREIEEGNQEIEKILTPEQRSQFQKMRLRMLPRRDHGAAPGSSLPSLRGQETGQPGTAPAPQQSAPGSPRP